VDYDSWVKEKSIISSRRFGQHISDGSPGFSLQERPNGALIHLKDDGETIFKMLQKGTKSEKFGRGLLSRSG